MDMMDGETEVRDYALERLIMLSDGVFAIAMTLLALDLRPQDGWVRTVPGLLSAIAVPFQAFFWSFFATGTFWLSHRRQFGNFRRADAAVSIINLVLLGEIILIPAATKLLTELYSTPSAIALYLGLFLLIGCTNAVNWVYAAFFTDILRPPRRGPAEKWVIAVLQAILPVGMTALGVLSPRPGLRFLLALIPVVVVLTRQLRRAAIAWDQRVSRSGLP